MSTSQPPNGRAASDDAEGGPEHPDTFHLSLPTFHSVRESSNEREGRGARTESTASGSAGRRSRSRNPDSQSSRLLERLSFTAGGNDRSDGDSKSKDKEKEKEKERERENGKAKGNDAPRHNISRRSGGFLLEPVSNSKRLSRGSPTPPARKDSEGTRNNGDSELTLMKRRHKTNGHPGSSFKRSPLASEVKQDSIIHSYPSSDQLVPGTDIRRSLSSSHNGSQFAGIPASASRHVEMQRTPVAKVGFDNDPAQIVNMALSLSEGRRRLASGRRYVSTEQGERRVVSSASTVNPSNTVRRRSIAPFLATNRQSSQSGSPKRNASTKHRDSNGPTTPPSVDVSATEDVPNFDVDPVFVDQLSPATAARVEKAKVYFELAHEHRRLLPHLPPIRKPGTQIQFTGPETMQKAYNPLQYVRNRKLRIWEKTQINSEAEGWYDIQKVRVWVDAVVSSHPDTQHDSLECVRLPPLDLRSADNDREDTDDSPDEPKKSPALPRVQDQLHPKPTRPRSDWVTHPADMIADAYWLEQGLNKTKIQDRDNNLIYPPHTHFTFSGWRNQTPVDIPSRLQQASPVPEVHENSFEETPSSALPELPTFKSAHHAHKTRHHSRRRDIIRDSVHGKSGSSSRERSRIRKKLFHDSSDSDYSASMSSDDAGIERGRKRLRRKRHDAPVNNGLEKRGAHSQSKQSPQALGHGHGDSSQGSSAPTSKRASIDQTGLNKLSRMDSLKKSTPLARSRNRQDSSRPQSVQIPVRSSLEHEHQPRASTEYDTTTAPNSPNGVEWPSIAINLSPPPSRPSSPSKKPISTILHPFHRKSQKSQGQVSTTDFAHVPPVHSVHEHEKDKYIDSPDSRGQSPMTRDLDSLSKNHTNSTEVDDMTPQSSIENRHSTASKASTRPTTNAGNDHSRIRAIFKGGRIAEIVGNEVSRVGDFIWKRDLPMIYRHRGSASEGSIRSYEGSDSEKEQQHHRHHHHHHQQQQQQQQQLQQPQNGTILKTPPHPARSRSSTVSSTKSDHVSPVVTKTSNLGNDRPRYNHPNLPSFTSPFQKDRERQEKKQGFLAPDDAAMRGDSADHISRLAAQHRSASHSPRLAALPKLDTGAPTTPNEVSRQKSYGFGAALDLSRSRDASDQLNSVIGPVTGLSALRTTKSTGDLSKMGGSELGQEDGEPADVTWRDIERAQVLLYTSTVKAREIGRRAEDSGEEMPQFLLESLTPESKALHSANPFRVKKRERHIIAAQNIMRTLEGHSSTFNKKLHSFTTSLIPALHSQLQILEDQIEKNMTPQVRMTADSAGELSMKLSTTSTLAVKELNDSIEVAFRRKRRGPIRLFRRLWFAGIEWTVVGLLWLIWAVVSVVRFTLGTGRCVVKGVRWLLWID